MEPGKKKRQATSQLTKDGQDDEGWEEMPTGPMPKASEEEMARRKIVRVKRDKPGEGTGGLFKGITTSGPGGGGGFGSGFMASMGANSTGGFGGGAPLFKPPSSAPVSLIAAVKPADKGEAKKEDEAPPSSSPPPASSVFNFTAPPSFGTKFAPPTKSLFPPVAADSGFSFATLTSENKMAKIAEETKSSPASFSPTAKPDEASKVFSPAPPSYKQPETAKGLEVQSTSASGLEDDQTLFSLSGVVLLQAKIDGSARTWAERGEGTLKITQPKGGGVCRLLMWRDQTHQLLLNENIIPETLALPAVEPKPKAMMFVLLDNGESKTFSIKLKKVEDDMNALTIHKELKNALAACGKNEGEEAEKSAETKKEEAKEEEAKKE